MLELERTKLKKYGGIGGRGFQDCNLQRLVGGRKKKGELLNQRMSTGGASRASARNSTRP
jgi:hypothetical protein